MDITPPFPVTLAANGDPMRKSISADGRLEANVVIFERPSSPILLVSFDLLYVGPLLRNLINQSLAEDFDAANILLFATHTHSAPATDPTKPRLGKADDRYVSWVVQQVSGAVRRLLGSSRGSRANLEVTSGDAAMGVNRRKPVRISVSRRGFKFGLVGAGANPSGPRDDQITVLTLRSEVSGQPLAIIWNYACHPVGHPGPGVLSAHFPGWVRQRIRSNVASEDLPVLFLQGFSGDIRPNSPSTNMPTTRGWWRAGGYSGFSDSDYEYWCSKLSDVVAGLVQKPGARATGATSSVHRIELPRANFVVGSEAAGPVEFASLVLGNDVRIVGVSAEVVVAYSEIVRCAAKEQWALPSGCLGDVVGYVPTDRMLAEGGYEAGGFCPNFSCDAVAHGVQASTVAGLQSVAAAQA